MWLQVLLPDHSLLRVSATNILTRHAAELNPVGKHSDNLKVEPKSKYSRNRRTNQPFPSPPDRCLTFGRSSSLPIWLGSRHPKNRPSITQTSSAKEPQKASVPCSGKAHVSPFGLCSRRICSLRMPSCRVWTVQMVLAPRWPARQNLSPTPTQCHSHTSFHVTIGGCSVAASLHMTLSSSSTPGPWYTLPYSPLPQSLPSPILSTLRRYHFP